MRSGYPFPLLVLVLFLASCASTHAASGPMPHARHVDRALGSGISPATLWVEPSSGVRPLVRLLDKAQHSIFVEAYILSDRSVIRALERAAASGVQVNVMLEPHPFGLSSSQPEGVASILRAAGVAVRRTRPGFRFTHAKFMVLDDRLAIVSTANFSRSAFTHNREFLAVDSVPADVFQISNLFRADWDRSRVTLGDPNLLTSPDNARVKLVALVHRAHRSVDIYGEELADPSVEKLLVHTVAKGIKVRVLLPASTAASVPSSITASGVAIRSLSNPYLHAKVVIVDGVEAFLGSENLSSTSLDRNRELGVLVQGETIRRLESTFATDWANASLN